MGSLSYLLLALFFAFIAFQVLDRQRQAQFMTRRVKGYSWTLAKLLLGLVMKLLRKVTSIFDPY